MENKVNVIIRLSMSKAFKKFRSILKKQIEEEIRKQLKEQKGFVK